MRITGTTKSGIDYVHDTETGRTSYDFKVGDRVRWSTPFLRSTGQYAGPEAPASYGPWATGTLAKRPDRTPSLVTVRWEDGTVGGAHILNLAPASFFPSWEV